LQVVQGETLFGPVCLLALRQSGIWVLPTTGSKKESLTKPLNMHGAQKIGIIYALIATGFMSL
jgi:hypothetical protein